MRLNWRGIWVALREHYGRYGNAAHLLTLWRMPSWTGQLDLRTTRSISRFKVVAGGFGIIIIATALNLTDEINFAPLEMSTPIAHHAGELPASYVASLHDHLCPSQGTYHPESGHFRFYHVSLQRPVEDSLESTDSMIPQHSNTGHFVLAHQEGYDFLARKLKDDNDDVSWDGAWWRTSLTRICRANFICHSLRLQNSFQLVLHRDLTGPELLRGLTSGSRKLPLWGSF